MLYFSLVGIEKNPNGNIEWCQMGAFSLERVQIYIQAAEELNIPYELIPNDDERVKDPLKFMRAGTGEQIIDVRYGIRFEEYWRKVNELSPSPPSHKPNSTSPESVTSIKLESAGIDAIPESGFISGTVFENVT